MTKQTNHWRLGTVITYDDASLTSTCDWIDQKLSSLSEVKWTVAYTSTGCDLDAEAQFFSTSMSQHVR